MPRALVYHGPRDLRLESRPRPRPAPGEVVLRVLACGVCGTDLRISSGAHPEFSPGTLRVPGHEIAGTVYEVGTDASGVTEGDHIFVAPNVGCGHCVACLAGRENRCLNFEAFGITMDGGFADYLRVPRVAVARGNLLTAPPDIEPWALTLAEPLAAVLRGQRACRTSPGDTVLVCGAGPIGLLHVLAAKYAGARRVLVSEPGEPRRRQALDFGADDAIDPAASDLSQTVLESTGGLGADVVIVATPSAEVQADAVRVAALGGRINFFGGLPSGGSQVVLDTNLIHYRELTVTGSTGNTVDDCREALALLAQGAIDVRKVVTGRFPLSRAGEAITTAGSGDHLKVIIEPDEA